MTVFCECLAILFSVAQPWYRITAVEAERFPCYRGLCTVAHVLRKAVCLQRGARLEFVLVGFYGFLGLVGEGRIFSFSVPYILMTTSHYSCRYIFKHLPVDTTRYSTGAFLCKVNDYQVSFLKGQACHQGHTGTSSTPSGCQSSAQPDVLNHTKGPGGFVQKGYESQSSRQVIPNQ